MPNLLPTSLDLWHWLFFLVCLCAAVLFLAAVWTLVDYVIATRSHESAPLPPVTHRPVNSFTEPAARGFDASVRRQQLHAIVTARRDVSRFDDWRRG